jgi:cytochrome c
MAICSLPWATIPTRTIPAIIIPLTNAKGREAWDAQRTAANTNDFRGKVLRIHPEPGGGYTIPDGNLFPKGTQGTRPEIYVMGCRNPFRISVDAKRGWLYWGDVGQNTIDDPSAALSVMTNGT